MGPSRIRTAIALTLATVTTASALTMAGSGPALAAPPDSSPPPVATSAVNIVDKDATPQTKSLFSYLNSARGEGVLYGVQNTTTNGVTFSERGDGTQSDVLAAVGDYPAVFGFDTGDYLGYGPPRPPAEVPAEISRFTADIENAHELGGIPTISAHLPNFATGKSFSDPTGNTVAHILPGGDKNAEFTEHLDQLATVIKDAKDADGDPIPMILRPFHENTGTWFWWGASNATTGEFKEIYRYTVEYLRDTQQIHNLLYSFSPNGSFAGDQQKYLDTYPGDSWVDVLGYDSYENSNVPDNSDSWISATVTDLAMISEVADEKGKIAAFTEFGRNGDRTFKPDDTNKSLTYFTDLIDAIEANPAAKRIAYMMTWVNWGLDQFYTPYPAFGSQPAHQLLPDFQAMHDDPYTVFRDEIPADAFTRAVSATPATPTVRVVSPADGVRITTPTTTIRVKATVDTPTAVSYTWGDDPTTYPLTLGDDGYWEGTWQIGEANLTNAASQLSVEATYAGQPSLTTVSNVILGAKVALPNGTVDDFEGYGDDAALQASYAYSNASASDLTLDPDTASQGKQGARFAYDFTARDYGGFGKSLTPAQDWSGFTQLNAHLVPDGSDQKMVLQFTAGGATFEAYPSLAGTTPVDLTIPFSDFKDKAGTHPSPTLAQLKDVTTFYVYLNKTDTYTKPGSIGLDGIRAAGSTTPAPTMIDVPTAPVWTDTCGPNDNGSFSGYANTDRYTWKVVDHSSLNGKVGIVVTAKAGYAFPDGARVQWTRTQDNTRCAAAITVTTAPQTCSTSGQPVPGSLTLEKTGIRSAYVYVGEKTGTKAANLSALSPGAYLIIATATEGSAFNDVPAGWKPSPTKDADGHTVKVSRVVEVGATDCGS